MFNILFQLPITTDVVNDPAVQQGASVFSEPAFLLVALLVGTFIFFLLALMIIRHFARKSRSVPEQYQMRLIQVLVPKESLKKEEGGGSNNQQGIRESIAVAETFYSAVAGMKAQKGFGAWFWGRDDVVSFEIVAHEEEIRFYIAIPKYLFRFIEQQIQAQFPEAHIEEIDDYNVFHPQGFVVGAMLKFTREPYFPIKTYQESESDPLNALTQPLSQVQKEDGVVIQFVVRSAPASWHEWGRKIASTMRQGKSFKDARKEVNGGVAKFFGDLFSSVGKKSDQLPQQTYQLSPLEEEMIKRLETKSSKAGVEGNIRVIASSKLQANAQAYLDSVTGAFAQFNIYEYGNSFKSAQPKKQEKLIEDFIFRHYDPSYKILLNTEELASLYHFPLPQTDTTNIKWLEAKRAPAPINVPTEGDILLGHNEYRGKKTPIWMLREDRRRHMYIIGKSGSGKSWMLANMARQDIENGEGVCVIDPHGDLVDDVLAGVPKERVEDVVIFDPSDIEYPLGMNLLDYDENYPEQKTFVINEMLKIFDKLYDLKSTGGPMFEQYMRNAMLLIMDDPASGSTLMEISKVLSDEDFRRYKLSKCKNQIVVDFWEKEAEKAGGEAALANMVPYITSKLNQFVANDVMRPIIGQQKSAFNFRELMDSRKILLVKLSKGKIGELNSHLLGMVIVGKILMSALSRTDLPKADRKDFYLYIDEFQNFTTDSIAIILSEARKYLLNLIIAHQYVGQLVEGGDTEIKDAVFGNVGTICSFKIGVEDADIFAKEFAPVFNDYDVLNVEQYTMYIKLLVKNQTLKPFSMRGMVLEDGHNQEIQQAIAELSRLKYGKPRMEVEEEIRNRVKVAPSQPKAKSPFDDL